MILYQLTCSNSHLFEAWFCDSATFDAQSAAGDIDCPYCGDNHVNKVPMAPHVASGKESGDNSQVRAQEVAEKILEAVDKIRGEVEEKCDYVGDQFAEEARRMHYGETEAHDIYGEATLEESNELDEEGIEHSRIPGSPRKTD